MVSSQRPQPVQKCDSGAKIGRSQQPLAEKFAVALGVVLCVAAVGSAVLDAKTANARNSLSAANSDFSPQLTSAEDYANRVAAEWVVEHFGVVTIMTQSHSLKRFVAVEHLPVEPFVVTEVNLYGQEFNEADLEILTNLKHLVTLDVSRTGLTESGLATVGRIQGLKKLYLRGNRLQARAFQRLANGENIESCSVTANYAFDDAALSVLTDVMPNLTSFSCGSTPLTANSTDEFRQLASLKYLALTKAKWSDTEIDELKASLPECLIKT